MKYMSLLSMTANLANESSGMSDDTVETWLFLKLFQREGAVHFPAPLISFKLFRPIRNNQKISLLIFSITALASS